MLESLHTITGHHSLQERYMERCILCSSPCLYYLTVMLTFSHKVCAVQGFSAIALRKWPTILVTILSGNLFDSGL